MPFIDKSTLTAPATNSFPIRKWLEPNRNPTSSDYKNFRVFDIWINDGNDSAWIMVDKTATSGTWINMGMAGTGILTITGDTGGAVGPDGANNINLLSGSNLTIAGDAGTNTLTVSVDGTIADTYTEDSGSATPSAGVLNILGTGGLETSGSGNTVTVTGGGTLATQYDTNSGTAVPSAQVLNVVGDGTILTSGSGNSVVITVGDSVATTYTADSGSATPSSNNLNVFGAGSVTTSGSGSTITITSSGGGVSWNEVTVVGPTAMTVDMGYVTNSASRVELLLPATAAFGSVMWVVGKGSGGWQINQNASQTIVIESESTTVGVGGTLQSTAPTDTVHLLCTTANTTWTVIGGNGNYKGV